ncbi:hypothetical protein IFM89_021217 [Coptis chinensis]|uniref:Uncharacterized protein n=1 Tax=Coptis chinensis TaxID=261450 RepID=A0A835LK15_9MAGN|nr:hypothetical protein IFM89_021217 [Coptis chinensis]
MTESSFVCPVNSEIPVDVFISRKRLGLSTRGDLLFTDASGNIVFRVDDHYHHQSSKSRKQVVHHLLDAQGNTLINISRNDCIDPSLAAATTAAASGSIQTLCHSSSTVGWQGCRGDSRECKDLIFKVKKSTLQSFLRKDLEVLLFGEYCGEPCPGLKIRGSTFHRSCTIYQGNSIIAQTSLLYKLHTVTIRRRRFRLTIFPGLFDHALLVALIVIFFNGSI